jgi:ABC-type phosphate/phosphonate transport system substrate-binding protein
MYDWPEIKNDNQHFWETLRQTALAFHPDILLPEQLEETSGLDILSHWQDVELVFSQSCWGVLSLGLANDVDILAQADYSNIQGGRGSFYRSAIIAREGESAHPPKTPSASDFTSLFDGKRFAYNDRDSLSGFIALAEDLSDQQIPLSQNTIETGSHRASVKAVIHGEADVAAIDCRSWALAQAYEDGTDQLVVLGWTKERLGLPYITSKTTNSRIKSVLRSALLTLGCYPSAVAD